MAMQLIYRHRDWVAALPATGLILLLVTAGIQVVKPLKPKYDEPVKLEVIDPVSLPPPPQPPQPPQPPKTPPPEPAPRSLPPPRPTPPVPKPELPKPTTTPAVSVPAPVAAPAPPAPARRSVGMGRFPAFPEQFQPGQSTHRFVVDLEFKPATD